MRDTISYTTPKAEFILTTQAFFIAFSHTRFHFSTSQTKKRMRKSEMRMRQSDKKRLRSSMNSAETTHTRTLLCRCIASNILLVYASRDTGNIQGLVYFLSLKIINKMTEFMYTKG